MSLNEYPIETHLTLLFDDDEEYGVREKQKKRRFRKYSKKSLICCCKTIKYTFLCCRCIIVWRCLWLFVILVICMIILVIFHYDDVRRFVRFIYIVLKTSIQLYRALEEQEELESLE